ncbi:hypothetical protein Ddc_22752 [Ditylenchus destructor]|nr:hypothetical protein Ddc_22752 [Ditylenchus destructor]
MANTHLVAALNFSAPSLILTFGRHTTIGLLLGSRDDLFDIGVLGEWRNARPVVSLLCFCIIEAVIGFLQDVLLSLLSGSMA